MKANQLGTLAILGVVVSFTAACNGSPTKPTTINPSTGDGASAASFNVSSVNPVAAVDQICAGQQQTLADGEVADTGLVANADAPPVTCDPSVAADQPQDEGVVSDAPSMDSARFAHRLHR
jgi:hypothetical protein